MHDNEPASDADLIRAGRLALRELPDAPEWRVLQAEAIWRPLAAPGPSPVARVLAALSFDSWLAPAPLMRSSTAPQTRQLVFTAGGRDIDVRITPVGEGWVIEGQVMGPDERAEVELTYPSPGPRQVASLDTLGGFRFGGLPAGSPSMALHFADGPVDLPALQLGRESPDG